MLQRHLTWLVVQFPPQFIRPALVAVTPSTLPFFLYVDKVNFYAFYLYLLQLQKHAKKHQTHTCPWILQTYENIPLRSFDDL